MLTNLKKSLATCELQYAQLFFLFEENSLTYYFIFHFKRSNKDCPVFPLTDPKHSNLCSFLNPSNNLCRFTEDNYILSKDDPQSYTQKFPSKKAFQSALSAASARKCEEDGDLPDIGTESVLSIARRMSTTTRDEKPKEIDNKQEEDGDLSTDNEDPGPEE